MQVFSVEFCYLFAYVKKKQYICSDKNEKYV